jgi:hypothetical protein
MAGITETVLIGYNDLNTEGTFVWHSGDAATYSNWNSGEPNNAGNEDYTTIETSGGWNDVNTANTYKYLLELNYAPQQTAGLASGSDFPIGTTTNTFVVTDVEGNSVTCSFDVIVNEVLSAPSFSLDTGITMYPNPATHSLTLKNTSNVILENAVIYDINGRVISSTNFDSILEDKTIDVSSLTSGLYLVKIKGNSGSSTVKRFIKK